MLDVTRLRVLVAVARCGSVTAAARALNYAQPSVSHHLARLEAETGTKLIQRAGRGIRLTDAGRLLAERAAEVIGRLDAAENELAAYTGLRAGRLRLAAFPSALGTIVPAAAARLREQQPSADLRLTEAEPPEALRMLRAGLRRRGAGVPVLPVDPLVPAPDSAAADATGLPDDEDGIDLAEGLREQLLLDEEVHLVTSAQADGKPSADLAGYARHRWIAGCDRCRANLLRQCALGRVHSKIGVHHRQLRRGPGAGCRRPRRLHPAGAVPAGRAASRHQDRAAGRRAPVRVRGAVRRPARPARRVHLLIEVLRDAASGDGSCAGVPPQPLQSPA